MTRSINSPMSSAKINSTPSVTSFGKLFTSTSFRLGKTTVFRPARCAAKTFSRIPLTASILPFRVISPLRPTLRQARVLRGEQRNQRQGNRHACRWPVFGNRTCRNVDMNIMFRKEFRIYPAETSVAPDITQCRLGRLLENSPREPVRISCWPPFMRVASTKYLSAEFGPN